MNYLCEAQPTNYLPPIAYYLYQPTNTPTYHSMHLQICEPTSQRHASYYLSATNLLFTNSIIPTT